MMSIKERGTGKWFVDEYEKQNILHFIESEKSVTLEMIVQRFPWIRWGDLFSMVGGFRRDGLIAVYQVGSLLEIRAVKQPTHMT